MTTETSLSVQPALPEAPEPSAEQLERLRRRKRFYRLRVILPMTLVTLLWLGVTLLLLWLAIAGEWFAVDTDQAYYRTLISGIADFALILSLLPLLLLCALPSGLVIGLVVYRRQQKTGAPDQPEPLPFFWRMENALGQINQQLEDKVLPKAAQPVVSAHGMVAYVRALVRELWQIITRENRRNVR
jgi:hypothetical protein